MPKPRPQGLLVSNIAAAREGAFFGEISKKRILVFRENPKTDHKYLKSTLWIDSSDQIQIWVFEMHHLSVFLGKDSKKSIFDKNKSKKNKNGTQQMPYMK